MFWHTPKLYLVAVFLWLFTVGQTHKHRYCAVQMEITTLN